MKLIIKGFIIGIGKILPGISGSMLAISLGIYEQLIEKISNINKNPYNNIKYLSKPSLGIICAIIITSKIIVKLINSFYFATILLFTGLIIGGLPNIIKQTKIKRKNIIISIIIVIMLLITNNIKIRTHQVNYNIIEIIKLIGIGIIDAASSIIPGISGTAILMTLGYYNIILESFSTILEKDRIYINIFILTPFIIGFITGILVISKIINKALKKYKDKINTLIIIFMITTILTVLKTAINKVTNNIETIIGIVLFIVGMIISIKLENKNTKK